MSKPRSRSSSIVRDSASTSSTPRTLGPPQSRPLVPKKPHRRGPYACDECRLRKRACDAGNPCRLCRRFDTECTYDFRRHTPRPTTRIRALQDRLRQAHGWMQHVRTKLPQGVPDLDLDECIRVLDFNVPEKDETNSSIGRPTSSTSSPAQRGHEDSSQERATEQGLFIPGGIRIGNTNSYYGPLSDVSFILRTVETLQVIPASSTGTPIIRDIAAVSDLIDRSPTQSRRLDPSRMNRSVFDIPPNAQDLVRALLERQDLMLSFIAETDIASWARESHGELVAQGEIALLHAILALAYLYNVNSHMGDQCSEATQLATEHFEISVQLNTSSDLCDESSLATTICGALFQLALSRQPQAYSLIGIASSTALRLGLLSDNDRSDTVPTDSYNLRSRLVATVLCLDMVGAIILDLPPFLRTDLMPFSRISSFAQRAERNDDLHTAALFRQAALLAIPVSIRVQPGAIMLSDDEERQAQLFKNAVHDFQKRATESAPLLAKLAEVQRLRCIKKELEVTYHLSHVILFRPHLYYIRDMYAGKRISLAESYYALACIKAASSIVPLAESMAPAPESWLTLHAVSSAVMCLVYLVAAHPSTTLPSVAWQRARRGIRVIAANKCADNASSTSIEVLKVITHTLRQTVYIDFDGIEATTRKRCNNQMASVNIAASRSSSFSQEDFSFTLGDNDFTMGNLTTDGLACNEADRMLEQAEALEGDMDFEDWLNFHEFSE